jgi:hypothetical protein
MSPSPVTLQACEASHIALRPRPKALNTTSLWSSAVRLARYGIRLPFHLQWQAHLFFGRKRMSVRLVLAVNVFATKLPRARRNGI